METSRNEAISEKIKILIERFQQAEALKVHNPQEQKLEVGWGVAGLTFVYEKFRTLMDFRDEHVIRRRAIERIFRRRVQYLKNPEDIAVPLIQELIWARYIKEDVYKSKVLEVSEIVRRYLWLIEGSGNLDRKAARKIKRFLFEMASSELEAALLPIEKERALLSAMIEYAQEKINLSAWNLPEAQLKVQFFIACQRELFGADHPTTFHRVFEQIYPQWFSLSKEAVPQVLAKLPELLLMLENYSSSKLVIKLSPHLRKIAILFRFINLAIEENLGTASERLASWGSMDDSVRRHYFERDSRIRSKLRRAVIRSTAYIFLSKALLAFLVELPYDTVFARHPGLHAIYVNVLFPPILMFLVASTVRVPNEKNIEKILEGASEILYGPVGEKIEIQPIGKKRHPWLTSFFTIIYAITFLISFGLLIWGLNLLNFSWVSGVIFLFFLCLVSFFGFRMRRTARELLVLPKRVRWYNFIVDFFALPLLRAGQWIQQKSAKINVFVYFMDLIVEAPFKMLVEVFEDLSKFFREKKEEIT